MVQYNVAGIEIENSRNALVEGNLATHNTGGILVFDLPGLPVMGGGDVRVTGNLVNTNDVVKLASPGNIEGGVTRGTGLLVMANATVLVDADMLEANDTGQIMGVDYVL